MNKKLSMSVERHVIPKLERSTDPSIDWSDLDSLLSSVRARESKPEFSENNMEYDLRTTDWILEKVRGSEVYAQHLYAAMCNNEFKKIPADNVEGVVQVLSDTLPRWSCSWRSAGGIIADMREEGGYMDWYCSGIRYDDAELEQKIENGEFDESQLEQIALVKQYVSESIVTDEIRDDLLKLGWTVLPYEDE